MQNLSIKEELIILINNESYRLGIDIGSTTVKVVLLNDNDELIYKTYERHLSRVREKTTEMLLPLEQLLAGRQVHVSVTGSAGLGLSKKCDIPFVQEVFATARAVDTLLPGTDAVIELGGEDAKILFLSGGLEERMNGSCAGGTGAFIDQMANLLDVTPDELDKLSLQHEKIYSIASRCGVFAKSDIQPLLNQGANKKDIAASIFQAVVDQTIAGLAQGRRIEGNVAFLGGPLTFFQGLRDRFQNTLTNINQALFPENSLYYIAVGAALYSADSQTIDFDELCEAIRRSGEKDEIISTLEPLFLSQEDYAAFTARHSAHTVKQRELSEYCGNAYLGIDAGSTTTKMVLIDTEGSILYSYYSLNKGNPVDVVKDELKTLYSLCGNKIKICGSAVTGYGEDIIRQSFSIDSGIVETVAHFVAARFFDPEVDFILDIGGQDIKCFKVRNGAIDSIILNEACSSGCGSFIQTFASSMGYSVEDFSKLGLFSKRPVDLGSRCTVFMNSSVKQSQKEGAGVDDISAGISVSVVKNAIYKVIRASAAADLGQHIVVQGGTFLNDAVLRSFEKELGHDVVRPAISGLMGAYGAALIAIRKSNGISRIITLEQLASFNHESRAIFCNGCTNKCSLIVNTFNDGSRYISGNRCEKPLGIKHLNDERNMYDFKRKYLDGLSTEPGPRGIIGIPMGLNMYENYPFWHAFFTSMGYGVTRSAKSSRSLYISGQHTIPSDTVCYPAKIMHGHILDLIEKGVDYIFYPCLAYNFDEKNGDNHYNCPVVAYYPDLISANIKAIDKSKYLSPYFGLHRRRDFEKHAIAYFDEKLGVSAKEVHNAVENAYAEYDRYRAAVVNTGREYIDFADKNGRNVIVLAGRPYHLDEEINHGIDKLITSYGFVLVTEDAVAPLTSKQNVAVLNQWTYHTRLYQAAKYVRSRNNTELVQLVSFGCGIDAITTDEVRSLLESGGHFYTQLKIDEINNLGAVRIRIRSLLEAMNQKKK